jgi:mannose/fructose/N-acetylgalactosamine-specific phosphotransferase system component IIC
MKTQFNKLLYVGFLILGLFQVFFTKDTMQAAASLGIALAFDPFNTEQKWNDRPTWQKMTLITHLSVVFGLFFIELFKLFQR